MKKNSQHLLRITQRPEGISLIALIITIVVLIILASITIFNGLGTPNQAGLAKFATEISDVQTVVMEKYHDAESQGIIQGKVKSPEQIYYCIANGTPISNAPASPTKTGDVSSLGVLQPENLKGTIYYQIHNTDLIPANKTFYGEGETQYITNAGEVFILPGYKFKSGNETRWYIDEKRYYVGEGTEISHNDVPSMNLQVGDYVAYVPTPGTYTAYAEDTGYTDDQEFTTEENITWRVLSVDETTGTAIIIPTEALHYSDGFCLEGVKGYTNGISELNKMCAALYSKTGVTARSLTVEDILKAVDAENLASEYIAAYPRGTNVSGTELYDGKTYAKVAGYLYDDYEDSFSTDSRIRVVGGAAGGVPTATTPVYIEKQRYAYYPQSTDISGLGEYTTYNGKEYKNVNADDYSDHSTSPATRLGAARFLTYDRAGGIVENGYSSPTADTPVLVTNSSWYVYPISDYNATVSEILGDNYGWLASSIVYAYGDASCFTLFCAGNEYVYDDFPCFFSDGVGGGTVVGLRPAVTLNVSLLTGTGIHGDEDAGSSANPWGVR